MQKINHYIRKMVCKYNETCYCQQYSSLFVFYFFVLSEDYINAKAKTKKPKKACYYASNEFTKNLKWPFHFYSSKKQANGLSL